MNDDKKYWVAFSRIENLGPQKLTLLYNFFQSMRDAWSAEPMDFRHAGLKKNDIERVVASRDQINPDEEWEKIEHLAIRIITIHEPEYPKLLKEIYSPPALLYVKGRALDEITDFTIAVVGTRKITSYGKQVTPEIVHALARTGLTIVSGLALGVDALAHQSCLEADGTTIAVLGSGLDNIYPLTNRHLADQIIERGALITEYPLETKPLKQHFPARNRIISGLALGTLVIEGDQDSGSLITARFALEQNREVFAVPGSVLSQSSVGPNTLIKMGAKPVTSAEDVLEALNLHGVRQFVENKTILPNTKEEKIILDIIANEPMHIDELIKKSTLKTSVVQATVAMMEMKGMIKNIGNMHYVRTR